MRDNVKTECCFLWPPVIVTVKPVELLPHSLPKLQSNMFSAHIAPWGTGKQREWSPGHSEP
jgi:hypothetical protein